MSGKRNLLLLSNSTLHGSGYLEWAGSHIQEFLSKNYVTELLFVPYALSDHKEYTKTVAKAFNKWDINVTGIHELGDPVAAVKEAQAIFIGGGNTFRLLNKLYVNKLIEPIRERVLKDGMPYIGSSAGTNVATASICTTNDMPIVFPPSFEALALLPFNINPHYIDPSPETKHMGESREDRIKQYHEEKLSQPVLGLREGCLLLVEGNIAMVNGPKTARLFKSSEEPTEVPSGHVFDLTKDLV